MSYFRNNCIVIFTSLCFKFLIALYVCSSTLYVIQNGSFQVGFHNKLRGIYHYWYYITGIFLKYDIFMSPSYYYYYLKILRLKRVTRYAPTPCCIQNVFFSYCDFLLWEIKVDSKWFLVDCHLTWLNFRL